MKKKISIIVPVLNEEENIFNFYEVVTKTMADLSDKYNYEIIFTDNHSGDTTFELLKELHKKDSRVLAYRFSRNVGYQHSILAGYLKATGDAVIQLDCDLQDPPELISTFLDLWESGYQVVYGIRKGRKENFILHAARRIFYKVTNWLAEDELPVDAGDFRLIDREVVEVLRITDHAQPYLRGTIASIGFKQIGVEYNRNVREHGESKFTFSKLVGLAMDGIFNHSILPLRLSTFFGLSVIIVTLIGIVTYVVLRLFYNVEWPAGFTTIVVLNLISLGVNALFFGIIGEYIARIYKQVKKSHFVVVEQELVDKPSENKK